MSLERVITSPGADNPLDYVNATLKNECQCKQRHLLIEHVRQSLPSYIQKLRKNDAFLSKAFVIVAPQNRHKKKQDRKLT